MNLPRRTVYEMPCKNPAFAEAAAKRGAEPAKRTPVALSPIPWGQPDKDLARGLLAHMAVVNAVVIPFHPNTHGRVRAWLRSHGIDH